MSSSNNCVQSTNKTILNTVNNSHNDSKNDNLTHLTLRPIHVPRLSHPLRNCDKVLIYINIHITIFNSVFFDLC